MGQNLSSQPGSTGASAANEDPNPHVAWWCKLLSKGIACVAAVIAFITGIWSCLTTSPICIAAGIIQMLIALVVLIFEAPVCCMWLEISKPLGNFAEKRTYWQKAALYVVMAIVPIAMCQRLGNLFGAGLIFAAGVFYGLMGLGKKADRTEMLTHAGSGQADYMKLNLVNNEDGPAQQAQGP